MNLLMGKVTTKKVTQKKAPAKGHRSKRQLGPAKAVVDLSKAKARFLAIYSDPQDLRDEQDIAEELGVLPSQLAAWRNQPSFYEPGEQAFNRAFRGSLVTIKKALMRQAVEHSSQSAIRTLLELAGQLEGKGTRIGVFVGGGGKGQVDDYFSKLTDEELDTEIALRLAGTAGTEVVFRNGKVIPQSEVIDVEYDELDCLDHRAGRSRVDAKG